jgi:hypothetical protein
MAQVNAVNETESGETAVKMEEVPVDEQTLQELQRMLAIEVAALESPVNEQCCGKDGGILQPL